MPMNLLNNVLEEILYLGVIASIPLLLILLTKKLFRRVMSPRWHYYIWALLILRLILPYVPESSFSVLNLVYVATEQNKLLDNRVEETLLYGPGGPVFDYTEGQQAVTDNVGEDDKEEAPQKDTLATQPQVKKTLALRTILAQLWLAGVLTLSCYTIYTNIAFAIRLRRYYRPLTDPRIEAIFEECKRLLRVKKHITLYTSPIARTPSLYTAIRTRILLSEEYMGNLSDQEIRYIFLHELIHYKRKDIIVNWLLMLLQIIYFFQPLLWYAFFKLHEDCEISCDAEVLKYFGEDKHQEYGSTIVKLLRLQGDSRFIPVSAGIGKHKSSYRRRIIMIKQYKRYRWTNTLITVALILAVGLVGLTGCSLKQKDEITTPTEQTTPTPSVTETPFVTDTPEENDTPEVNDTPEDNTEQQTDAPESETDAELVPSTDEEEAPQIVPDTLPVDQAVYYGDWVINRVLAYSQSGTYSKEDAESLVGKEMSFSADSATCFGDQAGYVDTTASNPVYTATVYTSSDFISYYRMSFELLGLTGDSVTEITAKDSQGNGSTLLIKDENTLIVVGGGTYFELLRK
jgi:bla regulator protein blaR1